MKPIVEMVFGSKVYGTSTPESDTDYKGVAIPSGKDIVLQKTFSSINTSTGNDSSKNTKDDVDREIYSLHYYLKLLAEGQTGAIDMLFTPKEYIIQTSPTWERIVNNKDAILNKNMTSFVGYCKGQAAKYSLKGEYLEALELVLGYYGKVSNQSRVSQHIPPIHQQIKVVTIYNKTTLVDDYYIQVGPKTKVPFSAKVQTLLQTYQEQYEQYGARAHAAKTNQGLDLKALYHACRIVDEGIELLKTGNITFPRPNARFLLDIREGKVPFETISIYIDEGLKELTSLKETSKLRNEPDRKYIEEFILSEYVEQVYEEYRG